MATVLEKAIQTVNILFFEACEYKRHFLNYYPDYAIITNIDFDHPDYFKNIDDVYDAFQSLANQVQKGLIACGEDEHLQHIQTKVPIIYYGFSSSNDFQAKNVKETSHGTEFDVYVRNTYFDTFSIPLYGNHQVLNALCRNCVFAIMREWTPRQ